MIDKLTRVSLLLDFYGNLLTQKQREIMTRYFDEDMSLGEISEELNISRQAVHDVIKRSEKAILNFEKELGLVQRFLLKQEKLLKIKEKLILHSSSEEIREIIVMIDELIDM